MRKAGSGFYPYSLPFPEFRDGFKGEKQKRKAGPGFYLPPSPYPFTKSFKGFITDDKFRDTSFLPVRRRVGVRGLRVITARNPVHAALFLVLAFCSMAGI